MDSVQLLIYNYEKLYNLKITLEYYAHFGYLSLYLDIIIKNNQYIFFRAPTSGCIKSNATVISSNAPGPRCTGRSVSLTSVCRETSVQKHIDVIPCPAYEGSKTKPPKKETLPAPSACREQILQVPSKSRKVDVSCQCPEEKVIPVDEETQYESMNFVTTSYTDTCAVCNCMAFEGYTPMPVMV